MGFVSDEPSEFFGKMAQLVMIYIDLPAILGFTKYQGLYWFT